jgi:hypothetical protein
MYYATFVRSEERRDEAGNLTGQYDVIYSKPAAMDANVSAARGAAEADRFGINIQYDKVIVTCDMSCPIDETSILWVDTLPVLEEDGSTETPHDYVMQCVARSLNSIAYAVKRVSVS